MAPDVSLIFFEPEQLVLWIIEKITKAVTATCFLREGQPL